MNYLEIVQDAMREASVREDLPTTVVGATGIVKDFLGFVNTTYKNIQNTGHSERWFFRQSLDQTLALVAGQAEYNMPAGLQSLNWRTITCYETAKVEESPVCWMDYYHWRREVDTVDLEDGKPQHITQKPDGTLVLTPAPDKAYTLSFDGVLAIDKMTADSDEPIIPEWFQDVLVWGAVKRFAKRHEDGTLMVDAMEEYKPIYDSMSNYQLPDTTVQYARANSSLALSSRGRI